MIASLGAVGLVGSGSSSGDPVPIPDDGDLPSPTPFVQTYSGPSPTIDGTKPYVAVVETNQGPIEIELVTDAPTTVNSFAFLAGKGFYNGTTFFYVDHGYFAQAGDPTCKAEGESVCGGVGSPGYTLPMEESSESHVKWAVVAPAVTGGTEATIHGSQFRILYQDDPRLDGTETVFGMVSSGQEILEGLTDLVPCTVVDQAGCSQDMSGALVIESVQVTPASAVSNNP
jgi:peptidyl-prolyl cis-trans isomerase B (cyclophilin B)